MVIYATAVWFAGKEPKQRRKSCVDIWLRHTQKKNSKRNSNFKVGNIWGFYQLLMAAHRRVSRLINDEL